MHAHKSYPLVSCLCISNNRVNKLKRAIECFNAQTYPNKELVIVYLDDDAATHQYLASQSNPELSPVSVPKSADISLGELRNISIARSKGSYFCNWDDDDWYHANRLSKQMEAVLDNYQPASILTNVLLFDEAADQAYFSPVRLWEQSILCSKSVVTDEIKYPPLSSGEDSKFIEQLMHHSKLMPVVSPNLYIYVYHGANTWTREHFQFFFSNSVKLSVAASQTVRSVLEGAYSVSEGSKVLESSEILQELDYFYSSKINRAS